MDSLPTYDEEQTLLDEGFAFVAGVDEAGRGPLAGPVVCAAVILNPDDPIEGLNDSKKLTEKRREELAEEIRTRAVAYSLVRREARVIDRINILEATREAMCEAIEELKPLPDAVLIDAVSLPDSLPCKQVPLIKGDQRSMSVAAASILAKVGRDSLLRDYDAIWPEYGFASHKGYGTRQHYEALDNYGPAPIHRDTFLLKWEEQHMSDLGAQGEEAAARHLRQQGYQVLASDVNYGRMGQIDLVCRKGGTIYIVEVKTRSHNRAYGGPIRAVSPQQKMRLQRCGLRFAGDMGWSGSLRLMLVCLVSKDGIPKVEDVVDLL